MARARGRLVGWSVGEELGASTGMGEESLPGGPGTVVCLGRLGRGMRFFVLLAVRAGPVSSILTGESKHHRHQGEGEEGR